MQLCLSLLCLLALGASHAHAGKEEEQVTPIQKVIQLLGGMKEKGKKEKKEEEINFASKLQYCSDYSLDKKRAIKEENENIVDLKATIESQTAKINKLSKKIAKNQKDADVWGGDVKASNIVRGIEKEDFNKMNADYAESIDALNRAISTLKAKKDDTSQASDSFIQVASLRELNLIPDSAKKAIDAFVQQGQTQTELALAAPEAAGYEFQSSGVVEMLGKLENKFIQQRTTLQKEEQNTVRAYDLMIQDLNTQIKEANNDKKDHTEEKLATTQARADTEADLREENKLLASDTKFLKDLNSDCAMAKEEFEANQKTRTDEITAIETAVDIISSGSVQGNAQKHLASSKTGNLLQEATSLGQLRSSNSEEAMTQQRVVELLHAQALKFDSRILEFVALRAAADPMKKVKNMIKDLITKLMEEANGEADHKAFCDTNLAENKQTRTEKTAEVQTLTAEIDQLNAVISQLTTETKNLNKEIETLDAAMNKATEIRTADKAKNAETVADAKESQEAVAKALEVLKDFYEKAGGSLLQSFLQAPYKGQGEANGGVTSMLEVIMSDFARLESETKSDEAADQKQHESFITESKVDKAGKTSAMNAKNDKKDDSETTLNRKQNDLEGTKGELDAALNVFEKLKPDCIDSGVSYDERVAKRKEEIEAMKAALAVLSNNGEVN